LSCDKAKSVLASIRYIYVICEAGRSFRVDELSSIAYFFARMLRPTNMECDRAFDVFLDVGDRTGSRIVGKKGKKGRSHLVSIGIYSVICEAGRSFRVDKLSSILYFFARMLRPYSTKFCYLFINPPLDSCVDELS
ncbi:MAG: hypothetical protein AB1861_05235, partial [Cyanobacteriota bacterium]